jgi:hypothetical protein
MAKVTTKTPEGDVKREVVTYLNTLGAVVEPLYTGQSRSSRSHYSTPKTSNGRPDIFMLINTIPVAVEVKAGTKQSKAQQEWMMRWISNGGVYWVVHSLVEVQEKYAALIYCYG